MARALGLDPPENDSMAAAFLLRAADALLARLEGDWPEREGAWDSAQALLRARWPWAQPVLERLKKPNKPERWLLSRLPEWAEGAPRPPARHLALHADAAADPRADRAGDRAATPP